VGIFFSRRVAFVDVTAANGDGLSLLLSCVGVDVKLDGKAGQLDVRVPSVAPVFKRCSDTSDTQNGTAHF